ncbi:MAG TPA: SRPBCC family protein [Pirellulales bacterium]
MADHELTSESTIYVTYIASTPQKVWAALTSSEFTRQYFFGRSVESEWKVGSPWILRKPDGAADVTGEVRESDPPRQLVVSWRVTGMPEFKDLPESIVSYEIEAVGESVVRLTMTEAHPTPIPAYLLAGGRKGWPMILSGLKSLLETGKPLVLSTPQPPKQE